MLLTLLSQRGASVGAVDATLDAVTLTAVGQLAAGNAGALSASLDAATLAAAGRFGIRGDLSATLDPVTVMARGLFPQPRPVLRSLSVTMPIRSAAARPATRSIFVDGERRTIH